MKLLSLDQSFSATAWCLFEDTVLIDFGVIKSDKTKDKHIRIHEIVQELKPLIQDSDLVVLEGLSFGSISTSARDLAGLYYGILVECYVQDIDYEELAPTTIKKFATGSGKAKKPDMWTALPEKIQEKFIRKYKTIDSGKYDLADAYHIGQLALTNLKHL